MTAGAKTCFLEVTSVRLGQALQRNLADLPPMWAEKGAVWCDDYDFRVGACARTWLRPHAQDNLMCAASCFHQNSFDNNDVVESELSLLLAVLSDPSEPNRPGQTPCARS